MREISRGMVGADRWKTNPLQRQRPEEAVESWGLSQNPLCRHPGKPTPTSLQDLAGEGTIGGGKSGSQRVPHICPVCFNSLFLFHASMRSFNSVAKI